LNDEAVCVRCGGFRADYRLICPHCGHRPDGEGLLIAWLLSSEHLNDHQLEEAAERVRSGESLRPSERMLERARRALGTHISSDPGLTARQRLGLLVTSLLLTPLVGWVLWFWWRGSRPRAAIQALGLSLPATAIFTALVLWLRFW
jgi:hypothetical protein